MFTIICDTTFYRREKRLKEIFMEKKIAVLIPCYNEAKTIEKVVKDYKEVLP